MTPRRGGRGDTFALAKEGSASPKAKLTPPKWGVPLLYKRGGGTSLCEVVPLSPQSVTKTIARFSFVPEGAKEKLSKRKRRKRDFASAEATNAPRVGSAVAFEGKSDAKPFIWLRH